MTLSGKSSPSAIAAQPQQEQAPINHDDNPKPQALVILHLWLGLQDCSRQPSQLQNIHLLSDSCDVRVPRQVALLGSSTFLFQVAGVGCASRMTVADEETFSEAVNEDPSSSYCSSCTLKHPSTRVFKSRATSLRRSLAGGHSGRSH